MEFCEEHESVLQCLQVPVETIPNHFGRLEREGVSWDQYRQTYGRHYEDDVFCGFTESTARAFQLLHILLHELGHHHDLITTRSRRKASRGEKYAEGYALLHSALILDRYVEKFGPI